jgi:hypothetical protein
MLFPERLALHHVEPLTTCVALWEQLHLNEWFIQIHHRKWHATKIREKGAAALHREVR